MRLIAEDVTMQDLKGVVADAKTEAARAAGRSGIAIGTLVTLFLTGAVLSLFFIAGLLRFAPPSTGGNQGVVPPLIETGPAAAPQGGTPAPLLVPGLPPGAERK
jgi:hypothetical protein